MAKSMRDHHDEHETVLGPWQTGKEVRPGYTAGVAHFALGAPPFELARALLLGAAERQALTPGCSL